MTLQELYQNIDGSYEQAVNVLRMDKLIDKHIRKFPETGVTEALIEAGRDMDPTRLFETSHALKGVCANLGLVKIAGLASDISEQYRPGNTPKLSDDEVRAHLDEIERLYLKTKQCIKQYEEG